MSYRDRAIMAALNFAGQTISSADGSYDLLISVIMDAMADYAEDMRARCEQIAEEIRARETDAEFERCDGPFYSTIAEEIRDEIKGLKDEASY